MHVNILFMPYCSSSTFTWCFRARSNFNNALHEQSRLFTWPLPPWRDRTHRGVLTVIKRVTADSLSCQTKVNEHSLWLKAFLRQWNIPGEKRDMFVGKKAFWSYLSPAVGFLRLLHLKAWNYWTKRETRQQLCKTASSSAWLSPSCVNYVPFRSYLYRGRRRWPQATLMTLYLVLLPPRLIYHILMFSSHSLHLNWKSDVGAVS